MTTKRPTKILVVDGDEAALRAIEQILTREGYEVVALGDPTAAMAGVDSSALAALPYAQAKRTAIRGFERRYLTALLERTKFNISSAARAAGVDRSNFRRLLKQYEISRAKLADGPDGPERPTPGGEEAA